MLQRDYLMRLIERALEAVARALKKQREGDAAGALTLLRDARRSLTGLGDAAFEQLTTRSLVATLGAPERVRLSARLCALEAAALAQVGQGERAAKRIRRAAELYAAVGPGDDPEDLATLRALHGQLRNEP